jgi:hypothetical protein
MLPTASPDGRRSLAAGVLRPFRWAWSRVPHLMLAGCIVGGCGLLVLCGYGLAKTSPEPPQKELPVGELDAHFRRMAEREARCRWEAFEWKCEAARLVEENARLRRQARDAGLIPATDLPVVPAEGAVPPPAEFGINP